MISYATGAEDNALLRNVVIPIRKQSWDLWQAFVPIGGAILGGSEGQPTLFPPDKVPHKTRDTVPGRLPEQLQKQSTKSDINTPQC